MNTRDESDMAVSGPFHINPRYRLQWEPAQECHVLLYPEGMVRLNPSAAEILSRCQQPTDAERLIAALLESFPEAEGLAEDVVEFLRHARRQEWIVPGGDIPV